MQDNLSKGFDLNDVFFKNSFFGSGKNKALACECPFHPAPQVLSVLGAATHDVLDASPFAMIRGVVNGVLLFYLRKEMLLIEKAS